MSSKKKKLPRVCAGDCHLEQRLLKDISRKAAKTVPWPHGGSSFLAILQPPISLTSKRTGNEKEREMFCPASTTYGPECVSVIHF